MRHFAFVLSLLLCFWCGNVSGQPSKRNVAVYVTGDASNGYKKVIGSKLVTGITRSEEYVAVERTADFLNELSKEQDYQISGAVSDNQIARLGQQFGVQYVLIADVSELLGSLFISARMVDVQTAQISRAVDNSENIDSIESLSNFAEGIALNIIGIPSFAEGSVRQIEISGFDGLFDYNRYIPSGFRVATADEIQQVRSYYIIKGMSFLYPVFFDIYAERSHRYQLYTLNVYNHGDNRTPESYDKTREYQYHHLSFRTFDSLGNFDTVDCSYNSDPAFRVAYRDNNHPSDRNRYKESTEDLTDMSTPKPSIGKGYLVVIKQ